MAKIHRYVLVQLTEAGALALSSEDRTTIRAAMASLNLPWNGQQPAELFQARPSLDGDAAIYELTYDDSTSPAQAFAAVAAALGMEMSALQTAIQYQIFGESADTATSAAEARAYLAANTADWEPEEV